MISINFFHAMRRQTLHHLRGCSRLWTSLSNSGSAASMKNKEGLTIFTRSWLNDECNPKAVVFISHGVTDHCGRHHKLATFLQQNEYAVYAHDHVGHGKSDGERIHIDDFQIYVRDLVQHVDLLKAKYLGLPMFIVGESMGGAIAAMTVIERPRLFTGAVFTAPAIISKVKFSRRVFLQMIAYFSPQRIILTYNPHIVSTDKAEVQKRVDDPLVCQDGLKAKWTVALYNAQNKIQKEIKSIQIPFLTLHGTKDKVVDIASSYFLMENAQSKDKTLKVFENKRHLLFHETEQEVARQLVLDWLNSHCSK